MAFVKSGWLLRQSTILKRWKKNWFDLWSDGHLIYYDDQTRQSIEDKVHMPVDCINIRTGHECRDIQPPDGKPKDCLLQIVCRDGKTISLCAESTDDCLAWKFALQDSRTNTAYVGSPVLSEETVVAASPPPYTAYAAPTPEFLANTTSLFVCGAEDRTRAACIPGIWLWSVRWCIPSRNSGCLCCQWPGVCCALPVPICRTLWTTACQPSHHS
ncbi:pleckstrin homology domain-containing family B member 2 isoform X2 [Ictidomys tridecemlineatus]